jgi:type VI secretion system (T6SS) phospholipase Tle1-like effector
MSSKRIIVCCDGTWNDADSAGEFTNVVRIARAILPIEGRGGKETAQIVYYQSGVGTWGRSGATHCSAAALGWDCRETSGMATASSRAIIAPATRSSFSAFREALTPPAMWPA